MSKIGEIFQQEVLLAINRASQEIEKIPNEVSSPLTHEVLRELTQITINTLICNYGVPRTVEILDATSNDLVSRYCPGCKTLH